MTLDHFLVARLARELSSLLSGSRIDRLRASDAGIIFFCYRRGKRTALQILVDSGSPLVAAYESEEPPKENGPLGWASGVVTLLRGSIVDAVSAVPHDRVLYIDVSSRSAFGVPSKSRVVAELQPRKANALVLRETSPDSWLIVAAAKQFTAPAGARAVRIGERYEPPPPRRAMLDRARFIVAVTEAAGVPERCARLLSQYDTACSPLLAREVVHRIAAQGQRQNARALIDAWHAVHAEVEDAMQVQGPVFAIRRHSALLACHLIPLTSLVEAGAEIEQVPTLNVLCAAALRSAKKTPQEPALEALRKRLATMLARCEEEMRSLEAARTKASEAEELKTAGEAIYAHLSQIQACAQSFDTPDGQRIVLDPLLTPQQNAAQYFRKYKKAKSGVPRIAARLSALAANHEYWEHLVWELDRAKELDGAARSALAAEISTAAGVKRQADKRRPMKAEDQAVALPGGARAFVGRSPKDNERLTFRVAAPDDYWFHARGIPGAHVIVKTGGGPRLSMEQIEAAAALAAAHSRAAAATSVEVDYTQRKHVRRHPAGRPGLVFYTDFDTVRVRPQRG